MRHDRWEIIRRHRDGSITRYRDDGVKITPDGKAWVMMPMMVRSADGLFVSMDPNHMVLCEASSPEIFEM